MRNPLSPITVLAATSALTFTLASCGASNHTDDEINKDYTTVKDAPSPYPGQCPANQGKDLRTDEAGIVDVALIPTFEGSPDMAKVAHPKYDVPFDTKRALLVLTTDKSDYRFSAKDVSHLAVLAPESGHAISQQTNSCSKVKTKTSFIGTVPSDTTHDTAGLWEVRATSGSLYSTSTDRYIRMKALGIYTNRAEDFYYAATVPKVGFNRVENTAGFRLLKYYYAHR